MSDFILRNKVEVTYDAVNGKTVTITVPSENFHRLCSIIQRDEENPLKYAPMLTTDGNHLEGVEFSDIIAISGQVIYGESESKIFHAPALKIIDLDIRSKLKFNKLKDYCGDNGVFASNVLRLSAIDDSRKLGICFDLGVAARVDVGKNETVLAITAMNAVASPMGDCDIPKESVPDVEIKLLSATLELKDIEAGEKPKDEHVAKSDGKMICCHCGKDLARASEYVVLKDEEILIPGPGKVTLYNCCLECYDLLRATRADLTDKLRKDGAVRTFDLMETWYRLFITEASRKATAAKGIVARPPAVDPVIRNDEVSDPRITELALTSGLMVELNIPNDVTLDSVTGECTLRSGDYMARSVIDGLSDGERRVELLYRVGSTGVMLKTVVSLATFAREVQAGNIVFKD